MNESFSKQIIGPGVWFLIHSLAAEVKSEETLRLFDEFVKHLQENFPCAECKSHMVTYIDENPYIDLIFSEIFRWSHMFHNTVNERLNRNHPNSTDAKRIVSYEEAYTYFVEKQRICTSDCDGMYEHPVLVNPTERLGKYIKPFIRIDIIEGDFD